MIKYFIAIVFLCNLSTQDFAQPIILSDTTSLISIGKQIDIFEEPGGTLSLQQILSPEYQAQFKSTQEVPNFGTKQTTVWCRIRINIAADEQKINHHGKRIYAIVKGMLQHSRVTSGQMETVNINTLADEYLRLSYHGFRAKDKSFNAIMQTDFDEHIGKINTVPQDIGRVLLNLYNNAFYAVNEKSKRQAVGYEPTVSVTTKKLNNAIELTVKDNGSGIPQKVVDKIFQPFFTTKPTGEGTGLGLSLSYDIIKAHGGEIKVETKEGEGSEFIVNLPA